jgi:hypothetical protein
MPSIAGCGRLWRRALNAEGQAMLITYIKVVQRLVPTRYTGCAVRVDADAKLTQLADSY